MVILYYIVEEFIIYMYFIFIFRIIDKFDKTEIHDFIIYNINNINSKFSIKNNIRINYEGTSKLIYESHFRFIQKEDDETSIYKCFVLYPKILNDKNTKTLY